MLNTLFDPMASTTTQPAPPEQLFEPAVELTPEPQYPSFRKSGWSGWRYQPTQVKFDPEVHLAIEEPEWKLKLSDFGFDNSRDGISEVGAVAPFRLFTDEAIRLMRNDLLSEPVQTNHAYSSERAPYVVRGYAPTHSRFIHDAWKNPKVLEAISRAANIDLVPVCDYEIGHTNIQLGPKGREGVKELKDTPTLPLTESERTPPSIYDDRPVDDWHYDYVPFVAVLMVSDTTGMNGGETAVMNKDGTRTVVPGPGMGKVVLMQGSRIKHAALRARNCSERIAMVTSLRPRDPFVEDMTHLKNIGLTSDWKVLGQQWLEYRLKNIEERCRIQRERLQAAENYDKDCITEFYDGTREYLERTLSELSPYF